MKRPFLAGATVLLLVMPLAAQTETKVLQWAKYTVGSFERAGKGITLYKQIDGVIIEDIILNGKSLTMGEPFDTDEDWLKNLTFRVRNNSPQPMTLIQIMLVLPEMHNQRPAIAYCYGCAKEEKEKGVQPDAEVELKILAGVSYYDWVKNRILDFGGFARVTRAQIDTMIVHLPDGTSWHSGCIKTKNEKNACTPNKP